MSTKGHFIQIEVLNILHLYKTKIPSQHSLLIQMCLLQLVGSEPKDPPIVIIFNKKDVIMRSTKTIIGRSNRM